MTRDEAVKAIREHTDIARAAIRKAEQISDDTGVEFSFSVAYGMGGHYYPNPALAGTWGEEPDYPYRRQNDGTYEFCESYSGYGAEDDEGFWYSSSMGC